ncbi:hypothetical protein [Niveispirillum irakense]|uniref:hypothetical protein n=1 Tax=Niveispirillum irakense TaxID=34011 RepID=UPI0004250656|nr:hypothetical protein [Niveispirillum irakense]
MDSPLLTEMREWQPRGKGRDDGLDAVAGAILACPPQHPDRALPRRAVQAAIDFTP